MDFIAADIVVVGCFFFSKSFKQSLFFWFGHLFHNSKVFLLPAIFKWFGITFAAFYSCTAPGLSLKALLVLAGESVLDHIWFCVN